ncbi:hypothetical protein MN116_001222 [Schistosoma mekongi]|uniref:Uncharacterized protein n=1 Tax=Schistosoma mekongi TaxID=38744 RepID=A0AAE1ZMB6_SCHME|nr:hypothetical protein MN116_001222 [Schistosoma mekongi]
MGDSVDCMLLQSTLMEAGIEEMHNHLSNVKLSSVVLEKRLRSLFKNKNRNGLSFKDVVDYTFDVTAAKSIDELYVTYENSYLVCCLESAIIQGLELLTSAKCESFISKESRADTLDISSTFNTLLGDKQLSDIRDYLGISNRRKHLFCLSSKLQNLKIVQLKGNNVSQNALEEELQLVDKESKVCYLKQRIEKLKSVAEFTKTCISYSESQTVDVANINNLLKKHYDIIYRLHEENEILLGNLPVLCHETKYTKQKLLDQLTVTRKIVGELICSNLFGDIYGIIQDVSFNSRAFQSGNNFVNILCTDSLYVSCCNLHSLEPSFQSPDVLLRCILSLIQESWLAENSFAQLHHVLVNLDEEIHSSVKLQKYDVKLQARDLKHLLLYIARLKLLIQEVKKRMSSYNEFVSNWKKLPISPILL